MNRIAPGVVEILGGHDTVSHDPLFVNKVFPDHGPGRLFAALRFLAPTAGRRRLGELGLLSETETRSLAIPAEALARDVPVYTSAEHARSSLVTEILMGRIPVCSAVFVDLKGIPETNSTGFICTTIGACRAVMSGPGLATSELPGGTEQLTFEGGQLGGFAVPNNLTGGNVIQVDLAFNGGLETVARVNF